MVSGKKFWLRVLWTAICLVKENCSYLLFCCIDFYLPQFSIANKSNLGLTRRYRTLSDPLQKLRPVGCKEWSRNSWGGAVERREEVMTQHGGEKTEDLQVPLVPSPSGQDVCPEASYSLLVASLVMPLPRPQAVWGGLRGKTVALRPGLSPSPANSLVPQPSLAASFLSKTEITVGLFMWTCSEDPVN